MCVFFGACCFGLSFFWCLKINSLGLKLFCCFCKVSSGVVLFVFYLSCFFLESLGQFRFFFLGVGSLGCFWKYFFEGMLFLMCFTFQVVFLGFSLLKSMFLKICFVLFFLCCFQRDMFFVGVWCFFLWFCVLGVFGDVLF